MDAGKALEEVLATVTPGRLCTLILDLARKQAADNRSGVTLTPIVEVLTEGRDLGSGSEGWQAFLKLKQAIMDTVALIPGMKYIEADA